MKKKIVIHSNHSRAFTGFGKHTKNILQYLYQTDKYEIVEFANGLAWDAKETNCFRGNATVHFPAIHKESIN